MANRGVFDPSLYFTTWFDPDLSGPGWFSDDLIEIPVAGAITFPADTGYFSYSGLGASFLKGYRIGADTGFFVHTGRDADFRRDLRIVAATGTFVFTGLGASFPRTYVISAAAGQFSLTGRTANFLKGYRLFADPGQFFLTGQNADFLKGYNVLAETGYFVFSGDRGARLGEFILDTDALGEGATRFGKTYFFHADAGQFLSSAPETRVSLGRLLTAETGSFTLAGQEATFFVAALLRDYVIEAEGGLFNWAGREVTFLHRPPEGLKIGGVHRLDKKSFIEIRVR